MKRTGLDKFFYFSFFILLFLSSCSQKLVKRERANFGNYRQLLKSDGLKKKVAILDFYNESKDGGVDLEIVSSSELTKELGYTREFIIDPRSSSDFGKSKEIYVGGGGKLAHISKLAKVRGIHFIVYGRIKNARIRQLTDEIGLIKKVKSVGQCELEMRVYDVNSKREVYIGAEPGDALDQKYSFFDIEDNSRLAYGQELLRYAVRVAARRLVPRILEVSKRLKWMGRIAKIIGSKVYINSGKQSGLQVGDILKVKSQGREIFDPETGSLMGTSEGEVKGTLEIVDYFGDNGSVAVLHTGGAVNEGDFVQLY